MDRKRILSFALAMAMCSMSAVPAFAEAADGTPDVGTDTVVTEQADEGDDVFAADSTDTASDTDAPADEDVPSDEGTDEAADEVAVNDDDASSEEAPSEDTDTSDDVKPEEEASTDDPAEEGTDTSVTDESSEADSSAEADTSAEAEDTEEPSEEEELLTDETMQLAADWFEWDLSTHTLTVKGQIPNTGFLNLSSLAFNTGDHTIDNVEKVVFTDGAKTGSDADRLFYAMKELTSIEGLEYLDTSSATNMEKMFMDCTRLTSLDLSHFDTSRVTDMSQMFQGCTSLKILNLGSFDTSKVTDMEAMFASCTSLKTIYASDKWNTDCLGAGSRRLFYNCSSLVGGSGTTYVFEYDDAHYARIDGGESAPGVFTRAWYRWTSSTGTLAIFGQLPDTTVRKSELGAITGANDLATQAGVDREAVRRIIVESGTKTGKNASGMFYGMTFVYDIARLYQLDTSAAESMDGMFCGCQELQTADVSKFDTSNVTDMARMFSGCKNVRTLALSTFDTSNVTDMSEMFSECYELTNIDMSGWDTSNVTDMSSMFYNSFKLTSLDLASFDTSNVINMKHMFANCSDLKTITVTTGWDISAVSSYASMFLNCTSIVGGAGTTFNSSFTGNTYARVDEGTSKPGYLTAKWYSWDARNGVLTLSGHLPNTSEGNGLAEQAGIAPEDVEKIIIKHGTKYHNNNNASYMFAGMTSLTEIDGLSNMISGYVRSMEGMFYDCGSLTTVDTLYINSPYVTNTDHMFYNCRSLTSLDLHSFGTDKLTSMRYMFAGCSSLKTIAVGDKWAPSGFTNATSLNMFSGCTSLRGGAGTKFNSSYTNYLYARIDKGTTQPGYLSAKKNDDWYSWDSENGILTLSGQLPDTYYDYDEGEYYRLTELAGIDPYDVNKVIIRKNTRTGTNASEMFSGMENMTEIEGLKNLDTSQATNMNNMFADLGGLTSLDLTGFDTSNVLSMSFMFLGSNITVLDLRSFDTSRVQKMDGMFRGCSSLKTIYVSDKWTIAGIAESANTFTGCTSIMGGAGTTYDKEHTDFRYARIDQGKSRPGYLSSNIAADWYEWDGAGTLTLKGQLPDTYYDSNTKIHYSLAYQACLSNTAIKTVRIKKGTKTGTTANFMFRELSALTKIEGAENLDTSAATSMSGMFNGCSSLKTADLSAWDTSNVTAMGSLFYGCSALTEVDLSGWDTSKATSMSSMFYGCTSLTKITVSDKWDASQTTSTTSSNMFYGCVKLVGGAGTVFNSAYTNKVYARIDQGTSRPGYLTNCIVALTMPYKEDFEGDDALEGWTLIDADGDGYNWEIGGYSGFPKFYHSAVNVLRSSSYIPGNGGGLSPDDWAITPPILIEDNAILSYWCKGSESDTYKDIHRPYIGTSPDPDSMTPLTEDIIVHGDMVRKIVDLRAYKGKVCYIGLRHYNSADQFNVYLDDIEVKKAVAPTSVTLDQTSLALGWGETAKLKATVYPVNADLYTVTWTSDAPSVATVDDKGNVTAVGGGSAKITAITDNGKRASCTVTVSYAYEIFKEDFEDEDSLLGWTLTNSDGDDYDWYRKDITERAHSGSNALISESYNGSPLTPDNWAITPPLMIKSGTKLSFYVRGIDPNFADEHYRVYIGTSTDINSMKPLSDELISPPDWEQKVYNLSSYNGNICYIAFRHYNVSDMFKIGIDDVYVYAPASADPTQVDNVIVAPSTATLERDGTIRLRAMVFPCNAPDTSVTWTSNDTSIATVNADGTVTGKNDGTTSIIAKAKNGKKGSCIVTVGESWYSWDEANGILTIKGQIPDMWFDDENATIYNIQYYTGIRPDALKKVVITDTARAGTKLSCIFAFYAYLETIEGLDHLDTSNVTDMSFMFWNSSALTSLDLSGFDTSKVTDMEGMFADCAELSTIIVSDKWTTAAVENYKGMFSDSPKLRGGAGTVYDDAHTDGIYARVDGGTSAPGYFTRTPVTSITLNKTSASLKVGGTVTLKATVKPDNAYDKKVTWKSSKTSVATVSSAGKVTAKAAGKATITATAGGKSAKCTITVTAADVAVTGITLDKTEATVDVGNTVALTPTITPDNATDKTITWSSDKPDVADVADGVVTAKAGGTAVITAKTVNGLEATCTVTVTVPVTSMTLDKTSASLKVGGTVTLKATVKPDDATDKKVTWKSNKTSVATVSSVGKVTAKAVGTATITATAGGKSAKCTITVTAAEIPVTSITLDKTETTVKVGEKLTLTATVTPDNATDKTVVWTSNDEALATVADGVVTTKGTGTVTITAAAGGKSAHCIVHIDPTGPAKPTVVINTAFGGRTVKFNCADADAKIYYQFGSSNITTMCQHVNAGETIFLNEPMTGNRAAMYFKSYKDGKWSVLAKWGVLNVQIAQPIITRSGDPAKNEFKIYTQTKNSYIVYTLDGTIPTIEEGTQKLKVTNGKIIWGTSGIVNVPKGKTIKAIAIRCGLVTSDVMIYTNK